MDRVKLYNEFVEYFKHKSIALVGSGGSVLDHEYGELIESHDIVLRINRGVPYKEFQKHVGKRTDVWSYGCGARDDLRRKAYDGMPDMKYSMYPWFGNSWVPDYLRKLETNIILPERFSRTAMKHCGGNPATTGADTLHFLITGTEYKEISIFGIDCYKTGYWFQSVDNSIDISSSNSKALNRTKQEHKVDFEEKFIEKLVASNANIVWYGR